MDRPYMRWHILKENHGTNDHLTKAGKFSASAAKGREWDLFVYRIREVFNMCVGLSAKVVKISEGTAVVDAGGAKREVLEDLEPGDYVMVHAGVAIAKITDEDEDETDQLMEELL